MRGIGIKYFILIILGALFGVLSINADDAYSETTQWESDFTAGILKTEPSEFGIDLKVSTFDKNTIKLEWQDPDTDKKIVGYQILRKTLDSEYITLVENTSSFETSYVDIELQKGFYGYNVIPILEKNEPEIISTHGIHRNHSLFAMYMKGQELLAQDLVEKICPKCMDEPFGGINSQFHIVK